MSSICLLLTREQNSYTKLLSKSLLIDNHIVCDNEINDSLTSTSGFNGLTQKIKSNTSWDKSLYYIYSNNLLAKYKYFYFIEDDVYSNDSSSFNLLFSKLDASCSYDFVSHEIQSKQKSPEWYWWNVLDISSLSKNNYTIFKSFNPICRLSNKLLETIFEYQKNNNTFFFHEILFPTLAYNHNLSIENFNKITHINNLFGIIQYRPILSPGHIKDDKIYHPYKPKYNNEYLYHDNDNKNNTNIPKKSKRTKKITKIVKVKRRKR